MRIILKRIGLFMLLLTVCCALPAQIIVTGVVKGEDNYGVPGANIKVKGSTQGTTSDMDGNYSISVPSEKSVLVYSFVGMATKEETVGKKRKINVTLADNSELLDEVVVVGYGTMKKSDLTGAIGSYRPDEKEAAKMISVDNMLQGKIAGLSVGASTEAPGAAASVTIRGANSLRGDNQPLYVIDNIPQASTGEFTSMGDNNNFAIATNALSSLNPADIESIEVLKDASATAIYGSRGANGVILITTKRGKAGKVQVGVSANFTVAKASNLLDMMDLPQHAIYRMIRSGGYMQDENGQWNIWAQNEETGAAEWNKKFQYFVDNNNVFRYNGIDSKLKEEWSLLNPIDWQKEIYSNAFAQNYNLTLSGGTDKVTYFASAGYKDIEGLVKGTGLKQGDARLNLNAELSKSVSVIISLSGSIKENMMMAGGNTVGGATGAISNVALSSSPYIRSQEELDKIPNIADRATVWTWVEDFDDITKEKTFKGSVDLKWNIIPGLTYNLRAGGNINLQNRDRWYGITLYEGAMQNGYLTKSEFNRNNYSVENVFNYLHTFGEIVDLNATAAYTYDDYNSLNAVVTGNNFNIYNLRTKGMNLAGTTETMQPIQRDYQLMSVLGRLNLSFLKGRYLLTASIRGDGSSKFVKGNRWAYFPAATVAWRMEQESFMRDVEWITQFKLRAGYGQTGAQSIDPYSTFSSYISSGAQSSTAEGSKLVGILVDKMANEGLKWERTSSYNIGWDFSSFRDRLSMTVDVYSKTTNDLLISRDLPPSTGYENITINQGRLRNKGIELTMRGDILRSKRLTWNISGNISFNKPTILDFGLPETNWGTERWKAYNGASLGNHFQWANIFIAGKAPGLFYGYQTDGIIQENDPYLTEITKSIGTVAPGNLKFVDRNKDGKIDDDDKTIIGNPNPDFTYGIQSSFTYNDITLSVAFNGVKGNDILNANARYYKFPSQETNMVLANAYKDMYRPANPWTNAHASNNMTSPNSSIPKVVFDRYIEDGSYLRCSDITLGYSLPKKKIQKIGFSSINVYASVKNPFIVTKYSGYDPEVNSFAFDGTRPGIDMSSYPHTRSFIFGLNLSF